MKPEPFPLLWRQHHCAIKMDDRRAILLVCQFLDESGLQNTLRSLERESGVQYDPQRMQDAGQLKTILDRHELRVKERMNFPTDITEMVACGNGLHAKECWCTLDALTGGANILTVQLQPSGQLIFSAADRMVYLADLPSPLNLDDPPLHLITFPMSVSKAAILCIDLHPVHKHIAVMGSMDRNVYLVNLEKEEDPVISVHSHHKKFVVRCFWSPSGRYFVSGSYDKSVCIFRLLGDDSHSAFEMGVGIEVEMIRQLTFKGAVEGIAMRKDKDVFVVGCHGDNFLHVFDLSQDTTEELRCINLNVLGDSHVSFTPMHLSFSPDEKTLLVSTDRSRLILLYWDNGDQIANFYGAVNEDLGQPRHCWHPSGLYIYGTSEERCICVWEVRSQEMVAKLQGHTNVVRDLYYCAELSVLVSCGFDGSIRLWRDVPKAH